MVETCRLIMKFITPLSHLVNKAAAVCVIDLLVYIVQKGAFIHAAPLQIDSDTHTCDGSHQTGKTVEIMVTAGGKTQS